MDTSQDYIDMCEKAEEIQEIKPEISTSMFSVKHIYGNIHSCSHKKDCSYFYLMEHFDNEDKLEKVTEIWLPRQDQLQEMLINRSDGGFEWVEDNWIIDYFYEFYKTQWKKLYSMEQLWLAFVMKEKYGKFWDGNNWK